MNRFAKFSWAVLAWLVLVILWGTIVRATGSGAGCGSHWPSCNGQIIPTPGAIQTVIEFTHRIMSGGALILILIQLVWGLRIYPKGSQQRIGVIGSAVFILVEAMLGAGLVLLELVQENSSALRAVAVALHLLNTFILLAFVAISAWWASGGKRLAPVGHNKFSFTLLAAGLAGVALIGMSGAVTALGDTLFPSDSIAHSLAQQADASAHFLVRLRIYHPLIAIFVGVYSLYLTQYFHQQADTSPVSRRLCRILAGLLVLQAGAGMTNVLLLAPLWMQVIHLLLADSVWIVYILLSASILSTTKEDA